MSGRRLQQSSGCRRLALPARAHMHADRTAYGVPQVLRRDRALPGYLEAASAIFCRITDHARLEGLPSARLSVDRCACLCLPGRCSAVKLGRLSSDLRVEACWGGEGL